MLQPMVHPPGLMPTVTMSTIKYRSIVVVATAAAATDLQPSAWKCDVTWFRPFHPATPLSSALCFSISKRRSVLVVRNGPIRGDIAAYSPICRWHFNGFDCGCWFGTSNY